AANPALDIRIERETVDEEYDASKDVDLIGFLRERMSVWPSADTGSGVIDLARWQGCGGTLHEVRSPVVLVVETSQDRRSTVLLTVGATADGMPQVEIVPPARDDAPKAGDGTAWVPSRVREVIASAP